MRHIVLALMIALLPLRGWVGDVMAGQMLQQQLVALNFGANSIAETEKSEPRFDAHSAPSAMSHCEDRVAAALPTVIQYDVAPEGDIAASDCATCPSCQICHSVVLALPTAATALTAHQQAAPTSQGQKFASVEAMQGFKPPIL